MIHPWKVSLHGGHSGQYCDHARGTLREVIEAAVHAGYHTFGISEHVPREEPRFLYEKEVELGWTVEDLRRMFHDFQIEAAALVEEYRDRIVLLRGFEAEVVPDLRWLASMEELRRTWAPDFIVGSVHHVHEIIIDGPTDHFERAIDASGSLEGLAIDYYEAITRMVPALRPDVVGHLDLIRKNGHRYGDLDASARVRTHALGALETVRDADAILDLNTAAYRKDLSEPYPAAWLVRAAASMGVGLCFGDDSHGPDDVGAGIEQARAWLLWLGVKKLTVLTREDGAVVRRVVPLGG